jgi:predicted nuclease of predicted toxin-antitoxin system
MRFLLDENAEYRLALFLRARGHDVTVVAQDYTSAMTDRDILAVALQEERIVVTNDRDFGELVFSKQQAHAGVVLFRMNKADVFTKQSRLAEVIEEYRDDMRYFIVIMDRSVRVRR